MTNLIDTGVPEDTIEAESPIPAEEPASEGIEATEDTNTAEAELPPEEEFEFLDTSEYGDRRVKLTIDGEEQIVSLDEVLNGYNSNAAATKRFQEAAAMKQEAQEALNLAKAVQNNPGMTMQVLASQAGLTVEQFLNLTPQQQQNVATAQETEPTFDDPLERSLYEERQARLELERRFEEREQRFVQQEADRQLATAVRSLQSQFGASEEDASSVVAQAYEMRVGPEMFPMIYQAQQYQKSQAMTSAQAEAEAAAKAEAAKRQAAASQASQAVGTGTGATGTAPAAVTTPMSIEETIRASLDQLGIPD